MDDGENVEPKPEQPQVEQPKPEQAQPEPQTEIAPVKKKRKRRKYKLRDRANQRSPVKWPENNGWYTLSCGFTRKPGGTLSSKKFYLSKDRQDYVKKRAAVLARWDSLRAQGHLYWPLSVIQEMVTQGLIRPGRGMQPQEAQDLWCQGQPDSDPLTETDLAPFLGEDGRPKAEFALPLIDIIARRIVTRMDFRIALAEALFRDARCDPKALVEWGCRWLGWSANEANSLVTLNINNAAPNPIAFNAFEETNEVEADYQEDDDGGE